jgi:Helicase conserved C-terminal domain
MTQQSVLLRLEQLADILGTSHLNRVARRFSGEKGLSSRASSLDALRKALSSPSRLDGLIRQLHPTELQLLGEVQRGGGAVDGWALYTFARLRGLSAPPIKFSSSSASLFGGYRGAEFAGADLIWTLFADGLLIPAAIPNAWLHNTYSYYRHQLGVDLASSWVIADPRLLSRLPPVSAARPTFTVASAPAPVSSEADSRALSAAEADSRASTALTALRLLEVCRGLSRLGGLAVTQGGTYNKSALGRLTALLPALADAGEWVTLAQHLGLARLDATGKRVQAVPERVRALGSSGSEALVGRLAALLGSLSRPEDRQHYLPSAGALRACLMQLLRDLPHATTEREVQRVMEELLPAELRTQMMDYRRQVDPKAWTAWLAATLRGTLSEFGVVIVAGSGPSAVITPGAMLRAAPGGDRPPEAPSAPAWILQPNFELLVYPAQLLAHHFQILSAAQAVRFDQQTATYRLTRDSVHAALESGLSLDDLLNGLQAGSATPLSANVGTTLRDWAARRERVTLRQGVTLLEYPTRSERDAAVLRAGGRSVGDHLIMLEPGQLLAPHALTLTYDQAPRKVLDFRADGSFSLTGPLDFLLRHLLDGRVDGGPHRYTIRPTPPGRLPQTFLGELEARSSGRLPATLRLQLGVWSGVLAPPSVAAVTLIQHAQAQTLAQHPSLSDLIGTVLGPTLFTVQPGKESAFQAALSTLGLSPTHDIVAASGVATDLVMLTDTRKKREYLEDAIRNGYHLLLEYNEEKYVSSGWHSRVTPGRRRLDEVQPLRVDRHGPTPYLEARTLNTGEDLRIRVQYILGLAIR